MNRANYSIFKAIADPTRREIIHLLTTGSALTINEITNQFSASRQAITKHIKLLSAAGLIYIEQRGRQRYCHSDVRPLKQVHDWVAGYEQFWTGKLKALGQYLDSENRQKS